MSMYFQYPNITGNSEREQITQIKSYLHQLVDQLNYVQSTLDGSTQSKYVTHEELQKAIDDLPTPNADK